ncbi:hypothetical protein BH11BAC2_BH11BAC2_00900 [soil metagenome]
MKKVLTLLLIIPFFSFTNAFSQASIIASGIDVHGTSPQNKNSICDLNNNGIQCDLIAQPTTGNNIYDWSYIAANGTATSLGTTAPFINPIFGSGEYKCNIIDGNTFLILFTVSSWVLMSDNATYPANSYNNISMANGPCGSKVLTASGLWTGYQWQLNGTDIPGANSQSFTATQSGLYRCKLLNNCGFATSTVLQINVTTPFPKPVLIAIGGNNNCSGSGIVRIQAPYVAGTHYKWFDAPSNVWLTSAPDTNFLDVSGLNRSLYVVQYNTCKSDTSVQITVSASTTLPIAPTISPAGPINICTGSASTLTAPYGVYYFAWYKNNVIISGANGYNYVANTSGVYSAILTDACGNTRTTPSVTLTVRSNPSAILTAQGNTTFCNGGNVTLQANTGSGYSYQWKKYSSIIAGATAPTYIANSTGNYKVIVTSQYGCSKNSTGVPVTVNPRPTSSINPPGPLTMCAGDSITLNANTGTGLLYQWRKNGSALSGATASIYKAKSQGTYTLLVTNGNGCTRVSTGCSITVNCRVGEPDNEVLIQPNPSSSDFSFNWTGNEPAELTIFDLTGKQIESAIIESGQQLQYGNLWPAGMYLVVIRSSHEVLTNRIIKTE